ncbi:MAG: hypothetical protein H6510_13635 [Acidobacteria bacterium]|nr:hypothetical protein [Acidobacteriota bacterium]MCB9398849.1 hypothetical protein [Acidobacteriota bacterium]
MTPENPSHSSSLLWLSTYRHALVWLVAANFFGIVLAIQLLWPEIQWPTWFSYGRVMPVHMNGQLYGWLALPLIALLLDWTLPSPSHKAFQPLLLLWSAVLGWAAIAWLSGRVSGKLFLDWTPPWALTFAFVIYVFWCQMLRICFQRGSSWSQSQRQQAFWGLLLSAPVGALLVWASRPTVYPAINPQSGGATGTALLGSSLSVVFILFAVLRLQQMRQPDLQVKWRSLLAFLGCHLIYFALLKHGHSGNGDIFQQTGLFSLFTWPLLLRTPLGSISTSPVLRRWYRAMGFWALLLILNGAMLFLPGWLDRAKFSNLLVAHAHLAMAGLATSIVIYMACLLGGKPLQSIFKNRIVFWVWHSSTLLMCLVLSWAGWKAFREPGAFYEGASWVQAVYGMRLFCGLLMLGAAIHYCWQSFAQEDNHEASLG